MRATSSSDQAVRIKHCFGQSDEREELIVTKSNSIVTEHRQRMVIIALGSNVAGQWGSPRETLLQAISGLSKAPFNIISTSHWYTSAALGQVRQPAYLNLTIMLATDLSARALRISTKRLESAAGRRPGVRWGPRPLDVDIVDFGGRIVGWPVPRGPRPPLILPHPEAHRRGFVIQPIADMAPEWRHPVFGITAGEMLRRRPGLTRGLVRMVDSGRLLCHPAE